MTVRTPVVLVTGPPAGGKTYLAELLAAELGLPLVAKNALKEVLYDTLGTGDVEWSRRLGGASIELVHHLFESHVRARQPVIVEANFVPERARPRFLDVRERHPFEPLELHCTAAEDVLVARYESRVGTRHAGHLDGERVAEIAAAIRDRRNGPLELGGRSLVVDTTDVDAVDRSGLVAAVRGHVAAATSK